MLTIDRTSIMQSIMDALKSKYENDPPAWQATRRSARLATFMPTTHSNGSRAHKRAVGKINRPMKGHL